MCATLQKNKRSMRYRLDLYKIWTTPHPLSFTYFLDFFVRLVSLLTESRLLVSDMPLAPLSLCSLSAVSPSSSVSRSVCSQLLPSRFCSSLPEAERRLPKDSAFFTVLSDMFLGNTFLLLCLYQCQVCIRPLPSICLSLVNCVIFTPRRPDCIKCIASSI